MANQPIINRQALIPIVRATAGPIPVGRGVLFTGTYSSDGFPLVDVPSGVDGQIHGVTYESPPDDSNVGYMLQAGLSNVQLRIGTTGVTFNDKLNLQDNTGVWQKAAAGAKNVYYTALQTKAAGQLCWAAPIASTSI
jgi:hypothetical protein